MFLHSAATERYNQPEHYHHALLSLAAAFGIESRRPVRNVVAMPLNSQSPQPPPNRYSANALSATALYTPFIFIFTSCPRHYRPAPSPCTPLPEDAEDVPDVGAVHAHTCACLASFRTAEALDTHIGSSPTGTHGRHPSEQAICTGTRLCAPLLRFFIFIFISSFSFSLVQFSSFSFLGVGPNVTFLI